MEKARKRLSVGNTVESVAAAYLEFAASSPALYEVMFSLSLSVPFEDAITLTDGTREVKLYHVPNLHTSGMLVGHVPDARVLFTADLVSDTFPLIPPLASSVYELIQKNGLSVEMIACAHGNVMPYAQLAYVLERVSGNEHATQLEMNRD